VACVVVGTDEFLPLARAQSAARGLPELPVVTVPHPIGGIAPGVAAAKAEPVAASVLRALTSAPSAASAAGAATGGMRGAPSDLDEFQGWLMEQGWGDGLPAIPPTAERVKRMLAGTRREPEEIVAVLVPRLGRAPMLSWRERCPSTCR